MLAFQKVVISLNRSYESKVVAVLSSDSRFLRSAPLRPVHPHCYSTIRTEIRTASVQHPHSATVRPHCARTFSSAFRSVRLHQDPCGCIDIRVFARILMKSLLYLFLIGSRPEMHLCTWFGRIGNRASVLDTFLRFSLFFFT